jgi:hypothetical protein
MRVWSVLLLRSRREEGGGRSEEGGGRKEEGGGRREEGRTLMEIKLEMI